MKFTSFFLHREQFQTVQRWSTRIRKSALTMSRDPHWRRSDAWKHSPAPTYTLLGGNPARPPPRPGGLPAAANLMISHSPDPPFILRLAGIPRGPTLLSVGGTTGGGTLFTTPHTARARGAVRFCLCVATYRWRACCLATYPWRACRPGASVGRGAGRVLVRRPGRTGR